MSEDSNILTNETEKTTTSLSPASPTDLFLGLEKDSNYSDGISHHVKFTIEKKTDRLEYIVHEFSKLNIELQISNDELSRLRRDEANWKASLYICRAEMQFMMEEKEKWKTTSIELEKCLNNAEEMTNKFLNDRKRLREAEMKLNTYISENEQLVAQVKILERMVSELQAYSNEIGGLEPSPSLLDAEKELDITKEKLHQLQLESSNKVQYLEIELQNTKDTLHTLETELSRKVQSLAYDVGIKEKKLESFELENISLQREKNILKSEVDRLKSEHEIIPSLRSEIDLYVGEILNLQSQVEKSFGESNNSESNHLNDQLTLMLKQVTSLTSENKKLLKIVQEMDLLKRDLESSQLKVNQLQDELKRVQDNIHAESSYGDGDVESCNGHLDAQQATNHCRPRERLGDIILVTAAAAASSSSAGVETETEVVQLRAEIDRLKEQLFGRMLKGLNDEDSEPVVS